jgi:hypothetical protein
LKKKKKEVCMYALMLGCVVCCLHGARRALKKQEKNIAGVEAIGSNIYSVTTTNTHHFALYIRSASSCFAIHNISVKNLPLLQHEIYKNTMPSLRPRSIRQAVLLAMMMFMLAAYASARIAASSSSPDSEVQEQENLFERRLSGCDTGSNCDCPDDLTRLYILDIPFICVPLAVADIIFVTFVPFLTCCALPLP